ncbi:MAG: glycosyltransferase [Clostridia bacterium]|nr:glycosyltransferase [Clostridia bacterium]
MNVYIVSLKYSPGHYSHLVAFYSMLEELGFQPVLYVNRGYRDFLKEDPGVRVVFTDSEIKYPYPEIALFYNAALENPLVARKFKREYGSKIFYVYHEPWDGVRNLVKEGFREGLKKLVANKCSELLLRYCDRVLLPSLHALKNYKGYEFRYNKNCSRYPLIFRDEKREEIDFSIKKYFSFIGNAVEVHQFKKYLQFVKYGLRNHVDFKFLIATRSNIELLLDEEIRQGIAEEKVKVLSGKDLSSEEINGCYNESFCVWNVYSKINQSGVLGKAFMFGSPVIAADVGSFPEFVRDKHNGRLISPDSSMTEINEAATEIKHSLEEYSMNARQSFLKVFYYKSNADKFLKLMM